MFSSVPPVPLSPSEREVIARAVDAAPPLRPAVVAEIAVLFGRAA